MSQRTDPHRKGAIIPAEYTHVRSYNLATMQDGWPIPAYGIDCETDKGYWEKDGNGERTKYISGKHSENGMCCIIGMLTIAKIPFAAHGSPGQCSACGTHFVYGEVWKHEPTGEHVHIGHMCGEKYGLLVDRSAFELEAGRRAAAAAAQCARAANAETRKAFLDAHPGLEEALKFDHPIVQDIAAKFRSRYTYLTDRQVEVVLKIATEASKPVACDHCGGAHKIEECDAREPITEGHQLLQGRVLGMKGQEGQWGTQLKMLVLLSTGSKLWVTCPDTLAAVEDLRGNKVQFKATVSRSRDDMFFGFGSRPTSAKVIVTD